MLNASRNRHQSKLSKFSRETVQFPIQFLLFNYDKKIVLKRDILAELLWFVSQEIIQVKRYKLIFQYFHD